MHSAAACVLDLDADCDLKNDNRYYCQVGVVVVVVGLEDAET